MTEQRHDPQALLIARRVQEKVPPPAQVILTGSRATGGWSTEYDIELTVLTETLSREQRLELENWVARLLAEIPAGEWYTSVPPKGHIRGLTLAELNQALTSNSPRSKRLLQDGRTVHDPHAPHGTPLPAVKNPRARWAAEKLLLQIMPPQKEHTCPIWGSARTHPDIPVRPCHSPRAGGRFLLERSGAHLLDELTARQKANLSYWIHQHNLRYHLFDGDSGLGTPPAVLDRAWVESHRDRTPSTSDHLLSFLRELVRQDDLTNQQLGRECTEKKLLSERHLQQAAGGCRSDRDWDDLRNHAREQGWMRKINASSFQLNLSARIYLESQLGVIGQSQQGFVAMWFHDSMTEAYEYGIKPALEEAGYEPRRIDRKEFIGKVDDEIMAEIRRSRFVVADFTTSEKDGARGGVYFEAGFGHGLGIDVIYTCRKDRMEAVHFDTNHFNYLLWETPEDLRSKLQQRIEAVLGQGPVRLDHTHSSRQQSQDHPKHPETHRRVTKTKKERGIITALCGPWGRRSSADVFKDIENNLYTYYVQDRQSRIAKVHVVDDGIILYLRTDPNSSCADNLDTLPDC